MRELPLRSLLAIGLALVVAGAAVVWRGMQRTPAPAGELRTVTEFRDEQPLPSFRLQGPRGTFTEADLRGRWHFLFFGYTQCPDVCPTALGLMKDLAGRLTAAVPTVTPSNSPASTASVSSAVPRSSVPPASTFGVVFVSVDPKRDTPELLRNYLAAFDPGFIGVTGEDAALQPLARHLGLFYQRHDAGGGAHYTVDHGATIYLIDPQGRLAATFSPPQRAEAMAKDFLRISAAR